MPGSQAETIIMREREKLNQARSLAGRPKPIGKPKKKKKKRKKFEALQFATDLFEDAVTGSRPLDRYRD